MKRFILFLLLTNSLFSENNSSNLFITNEEYAEMLYFEPRGISCAICHGVNGRKSYSYDYVYRSYSGKRYRKKIFVKPIYKLSLQRFLDAFSKNQRFMPKYRLSKREIYLIQQYLQKVNK